MGSPIVTQSAQPGCDHQAMASSPTRLASRVKIGGESVVITPAQYTVAGCPLVTGNSPTPCATLSFSSGATRVKADSSPVLLKSGSAMAIGPLPVQGQGRFKQTQTTVSAE
ncbi:hypothetical protein N9W89_07690 [Hellea sp.]|nr:hypothetical protein [Hellea sp.]